MAAKSREAASISPADHSHEPYTAKERLSEAEYVSVQAYLWSLEPQVCL